jgi:hypothetical protein
MLEAGDALRTWQLASPLRIDEVIAVEPIGDHRLRYLNYEGPISGNRGSVVRWDQGVFDWRRDDPEMVIVRLAGARCQGILEISRDAGTARLAHDQEDGF